MAQDTSERRSDGRSEQSLYALRREGTTNDVSFDSVFDVLSERRRRLALHALERREESPTTVRDVAEQVAGWERGDGEPPSGRHVDRVRRNLRGDHLQRLAELDLIEYVRGTGEIRYRGRPVVEEYTGHVAPMDLPD